MPLDAHQKKKFTRIILAYPIALILIAILLNVVLFGVNPLAIALPSYQVTVALVIAAAALLVNHTWLMNSTELTRLNYDMHATPEEWANSQNRQSDVTHEGEQELQRRHNAHRNATENTVQFIFLAFLISVVSPVEIAAQIWIIGFAIGRLGHTFSYLFGKDGARGIFMSISLLSLYGMASYLVFCLFV